jgi:MoxR-like ATPase
MDVEAIQRLSAKRAALVGQLGRIIVGQREVIDNVLLTIFCGGHGLIVGVPGLAKTLLVRSLGRALSLSFSRIQFTPDLMPSDITGTDLIEEDAATGRRRTEFLKGPIFAHLVLADEINRTPPKTQAAMLQTMQEREVTVGNRTYPLPLPFHVFATQNPIEMEGTYVLPEAQADRFMFCIRTTYPSTAEEQQIVRNTTGTDDPQITPVLDGPELLECQKLVRAMPVSDQVIRYGVALVAATRPSAIGHCLSPLALASACFHTAWRGVSHAPALGYRLSPIAYPLPPSRPPASTPMRGVSHAPALGYRLSPIAYLLPPRLRSLSHPMRGASHAPALGYWPLAIGYRLSPSRPLSFTPMRRARHAPAPGHRLSPIAYLLPPSRPPAFTPRGEGSATRRPSAIGHWLLAIGSLPRVRSLSHRCEGSATRRPSAIGYWLLAIGSPPRLRLLSHRGASGQPHTGLFRRAASGYPAGGHTGTRGPPAGGQDDTQRTAHEGLVYEIRNCVVMRARFPLSTVASAKADLSAVASAKADSRSPSSKSTTYGRLPREKVETENKTKNAESLF